MAYKDDWSSINSKEAIANHQLPIQLFDRKHIKLFLEAYRLKYPAKVEEYLFLCKISTSDWKFISKLYRAGNWHHYGPAAQRTSFWDLWLVADKILEICKTSKGYSHQKYIDRQNAYYKSAREHLNRMYDEHKVRMCTFDFTQDNGVKINAPGLLRECWSENSKHPMRTLYYFDYVIAGKLYVSDKIHTIHPKYEQLYIRSKIRNWHLDSIKDHFAYADDTFVKLAEYAKQQQWEILKDYNTEELTELLTKPDSG